MNKDAKGCLKFSVLVFFSLVVVFIASVFILVKDDDGIRINYEEYTQINPNDFYTSSIRGEYQYNRMFHHILENEKGREIGFFTSKGEKKILICPLGIILRDTEILEGMDKKRISEESRGLFTKDEYSLYSNPIIKMNSFRIGDSIYKEPNTYYITINGVKFFMYFDEEKSVE